MKQRMGRLLLGAWALTLGSVAALSQEIRATLSGVVTDTSGSVVVGAALTLTNQDTGIPVTTATNEAGQYRFLFLNPGRYRLSAALTGFKTYERTNIELSINQSATVDVTLQVGQQTETVTVSVEAPLLEADKADRGIVLDQRNLKDLPLNQRNPIMLANLSVGVVHTNSRVHLSAFSNAGLSQWSINGGRENSTEFLMDGAPNNAIYNGLNTIAYAPPVDAVAEFKVMSGTYDAQYGRNGGGVLHVAVKNGTNALHGSVYEFLKRPWLNANEFGNNSKGLTRQNNRVDQYGFSIGGPVTLPKLYRGKDRTFFFFTYEGYGENIEYPADNLSSVPTVAQRRGDFSRTFDLAGRLMPIFDPATGRVEGGNWVRSAFPNNTIPASRINPVAAKIVDFYPESSITTPGSVDWQNNFFLQGNLTRYDFKNMVGRIDHNFGPKQRVYGRWAYNNFAMTQLQNGIPGFGANYRYGGKINNGFVLDSVTVLRPTTILNVRASLTRWVEDQRLRSPGAFNGTMIGWPQELVNQFQTPDRPPNIDVNGYRSLGKATANFSLEPTNTLSLQPNLAMVRGRHTIKTGLDFRVTRYTRYRPLWSGGRFVFDRGFTRQNYLVQDALSGNGIASLLLGIPASGSAGITTNPHWQWLYAAPWVQDDFKISRRLTVNVGLRWDAFVPVTERFDRVNHGFLADQVNPITQRVDQARFPGFVAKGGLSFGGVNGLPRSPFRSDYNNFQPRVGAAFQLNDKTVLRGGWGLFFTSPTSVAASNGFSEETPYVATVDAGRTPAGSVADPFPAGLVVPTGSSRGLETFLGRNPTFSDLTGIVPWVSQFSFGIQRQLPGNMTIDVSYVGSRSGSNWVNKGFNELSRQSLALGDITQGGNANFLNQQVPNPFEGLLPGTSLNGATVPRSQLLRPFPQFAAFNVMDLNDGKIWYNSLQVALKKPYSNGLTFTVNYTLAKNIEALTYLNPQDDAPSRNLVGWDRPHRLVMAPIYELPFGPGRRFLNSQNGVVRRLAGGWDTTLTTIVTTGTPMAIPANVYLLGDPRLENPTWDRLFKTGVIDVNGAVRNVLPGEQPVFQIRPPFTLRTTPENYGNLRNQWSTTFDFSLIKNTPIREGWNLQFRAEAFNLFNTPVFWANPNLDPTSANFGRILRDSGQSNLPRQVQLGLRFVF